MHDRSHHDRLRAWIQGELSAEERARLERELAADPAACAAAEELRAVWAATASLGALAPVSGASFDALARRAAMQAEPRRMRRVAAAAAIVLALGALAFVAWRALAAQSNAPVVVRRTLLEAPERLPQPAAPLPEELAEYAPVRASASGTASIAWLESLGDARAVSDAVGRPVLVFGFVPGCPWCKTLREETFADAAFLDLARETVPVALDLLAMERPTAEELLGRGYPVIELQSARGEVLHTMSGPPGSVEVQKQLGEALERAPRGPRLDWGVASELAHELAAARDAERDGRLADAWRNFDDLARRGGELAFGREGTLGLARLEEFARSALTAARASAPSDADGARVELARVADRLADTPPGDDLRRVLEAWDEGEPFPALAPASSGAGG